MESNDSPEIPDRGLQDETGYSLQDNVNVDRTSADHVAVAFLFLFLFFLLWLR